VETQSRNQHAVKKTDWDDYYRHPNKLAGFTRRITGKRLLKYIKKYVPGGKKITITELGGGNSCFFDLVAKTFCPQRYYIVDNNQVGLDKFRTAGNRGAAVLLNWDILKPGLKIKSDFVFSVGLIEHFSEKNTRRAILSHFEAVKKNGILILGFPTPTFLYKITRKLSEWLGLWIFHDERPLKIEEVLDIVNKHGELLDKEIIWPIFLTQALLVIRKK
jgi:SAM-dependent methyltransferase